MKSKRSHERFADKADKKRGKGGPGRVSRKVRASSSSGGGRSVKYRQMEVTLTCVYVIDIGSRKTHDIRKLGDNSRLELTAPALPGPVTILYLLHLNQHPAAAAFGAMREERKKLTV